MKVIGLTGGVGSGKSMVTQILGDLGFPYVQTDAIGKKLMEPVKKGYDQLLEIFGNAILMPDSTKRDGMAQHSDGQDTGRKIDRAKLAEIIFHEPRKKAIVESIIHPLVKRAVFDAVTQARIAGRADFFFVESALLFEDHYETICDAFWYVYAPEAIRRQRLKASRGYSDEKIDSILSNQLSDAKFRSLCSEVIDNSGTKQATRLQLEKLLGL